MGTRNRLTAIMRLNHLSPTEQRVLRSWFGGMPWGDVMQRKIQHGHLSLVQGGKIAAPIDYCIDGPQGGDAA